jgi:uncharacterized protein YcbX
MSARVAWIMIAPVKALALESLDEVELAEGGPVGDRRFFLVDDTGRLVNNKGLGILQQVRPVYDEAARTLELQMPGGDSVGAHVSLGDEIDTAFWGITVPARLVVGPWSNALSELAGKPLRLVAAGRPAVDRGRGGAASLVSTASLTALAEELGVDQVDGRRFRMHFGIDGVPAHAEDDWLRRPVRLGEAVVVPIGNVGRCAVTTQNPETGRPDLDTLKALARYRDVPETTEPLPFGVHAAVSRPGTVRVGDTVEVLPEVLPA